MFFPGIFKSLLPLSLASLAIGRSEDGKPIGVSVGITCLAQQQLPAVWAAGPAGSCRSVRPDCEPPKQRTDSWKCKVKILVIQFRRKDI